MGGGGGREGRFEGVVRTDDETSFLGAEGREGC